MGIRLCTIKSNNHLILKIMKKSLLELNAAILLAACSSIFGNLISLNPMLITWYRMAISAIITIAILYSKNKEVSLRRSDLSGLMTGSVLALHWVCFYASIKYANVSVGVVCFTLSGFFTAILSPVFNKTRLSYREVALSSLTLAGVSMIFNFDGSFRLGIAYGIVSSLLFAVYAILNGRENKKTDPVRRTGLQMVGGTVVLSIILGICIAMSDDATTALWTLPTLSDWLWLSLLASGCTVAMCILLNKAQETISPFTVSLSFNLEPIYSIVLAVILFHEDKVMSWAFYAGLSLILLSMVFQMFHQTSAANSCKTGG